MSSPLSTPIPVRLLADDVSLLEEISEYTGTQKSKLLRLAIKVGLPEIKAKFGATAPKPAKKGGKR